MQVQEFSQTIKQELIQEHKQHARQGIYGQIQMEFAYHSNRLEGGKLSLEQVRSIFSEGLLLPDTKPVRLLDIEEITGHFQMFDEMLMTISNTLSHNLLKKYHLCLRNGVTGTLNFAGEYSNVNQKEESLPEELVKTMESLIRNYNEKDTHSLEDLARFHVQMEKILPFFQGNSRIGRIVLFKECLKDEKIPFWIHDENETVYRQALQKGKETGDIEDLVHLFKQEQDAFYEEFKDKI